MTYYILSSILAYSIFTPSDLYKNDIIRIEKSVPIGCSSVEGLTQLIKVQKEKLFRL